MRLVMLLFCDLCGFEIWVNNARTLSVFKHEQQQRRQLTIKEMPTKRFSCHMELRKDYAKKGMSASQCVVMFWHRFWFNLQRNLFTFK
ncbi:CLUMA_CG010500, isoform A [Clunio marinus]|uniref:CLUMA_CG010500, isoform A n=1 Tax=Clunio marinus TaxID=568069 RepID=A0A1J1IA39_9DIPT|nr:CLUMA_CG010500, isoform A [Clunio marinus]